MDPRRDYEESLVVAVGMRSLRPSRVAADRLKISRRLQWKSQFKGPSGWAPE